ncbi:MAG: glucosaminidase domain-containing protein [Ktedonobacteraceae bacterium]|nr:glucosaminidase domain-containing protein [Ktedonobacteraceae bacterium]
MTKYVPQRSLRMVVQFSLLSLLIILAGGLALLWEMQQGGQSSRASGASVVGAPTLPAATVDKIFARMGSPMAGTGRVVEQASSRTNIDDAFALAVWWTETNDGQAGVGISDRNPGGVRSSAGYPTDHGAYTIYPSYATAINDWFNIVKSRYINRGLTSVYTIAHPYVGTSTSGLWAGKVVNLMNQYHGQAPARPQKPKATPTHVTLASKFGSGSHHTQTQQGTGNSTGVSPARKVAAAQPQSAPPLSRPLELLLIGCSLLLALVIGLLGWRVGRRLPTPAPASETYAWNAPKVPVTSALNMPLAQFNPITPAPVVDTGTLDPLPVLPTRHAKFPARPLPLRFQERETETQLPVRRIILLPGHLSAEVEQARGDRVAVPVAEHGPGLLSRYRVPQP